LPSVTQLEYLVAVETHRHFGKAAKSCHVSQPTLSAGLNKLEEELGLSLFDRGVQPVVPTSEAMPIIEQARIALSEIAKLAHIAQGSLHEVTGTLAVGVIPTVSSYLLPLFLESLTKTHPKLHLDIMEMTTDQIVDALGRDAIDVGILALPISGSNLQSLALFVEPFYLYAHRDHLFAKKRIIHADEIDGKEMWLLEEGHCFRNQALKACGLRGKRPSLFNITFESGSLETLKRLVTQGMGYTLLPHLAIDGVDEQESDGRIVRFSKPTPAREVGLLFRRAKQRRPAIDALANSIKENLPRSLMQAAKDAETIPVL